MASASPFDDLLNEFDAPGATDKPTEDPLRGANLQKLLDLSKKLEAIAKQVDPSEAKHPLHGQNVPEEARLKLKTLVGELMQAQSELHTLEGALLEEEKPQAPDEPAVPQATPAVNDTPALLAFEQKYLASSEEPSQIPTKDLEPATAPLATPAQMPTMPAPAPVAPPQPSAPSAEALALAKEKEEFATYKATWEAVFANDPAQRAAHPEVTAYEEQMKAYFSEKETFLQNQHPSS